jgi:hypothetical protein
VIDATEINVVSIAEAMPLASMDKGAVANILTTVFSLEKNRK